MAPKSSSKNTAYIIRIRVTDVSELAPTQKLMNLPGFSKNSTLNPYVSVELGDINLGRTGTREVQSIYSSNAANNSSQSLHNNPHHSSHALDKRVSSSADSSKNFTNKEHMNRTASTSTASSKDSVMTTTAIFDEEFSEIISNIEDNLQLRIFHEAMVGEDDFLAEVEIPLRSQVFFGRVLLLEYLLKLSFKITEFIIENPFFI